MDRRMMAAPTGRRDADHTLSPDTEASSFYDDGTSIYVVVPVYNESDNLARLIQSFRELVAEFGRDYRIRFVLVDDGSTDGTSSSARKLADGLDLVVLVHEVNRGPGWAFGTAFAYLASRLRATDWVVTMEGDNTSRHELMRQMLKRTGEGYDVVLASPYMYGGGISNTSPLRLLLSHLANALVKDLLGVHGILTMSSFYRLYRGEVLLNLQQVYGPRVMERRGFESMIELLLKLIYLKTRISEVPMELDTGRRVGRSKMQIVPTILGYVSLGMDKRRWSGIAKRSPIFSADRSQGHAPTLHRS